MLNVNEKKEEKISPDDAQSLLPDTAPFQPVRPESEDLM